MPSNSEIRDAKRVLDKVINKARVHFYKPIQVAEILYRSRTRGDIDVSDLESYRSPSKKWRDDISRRLVGSISTSSARYQDDVFNENAVPPQKLAILDAANKAGSAIVENYIYHRMCQRWALLPVIQNYLTETRSEDFTLREFLSKFERYPGLKRSIDKAYEIVVYALFRTLTKFLKIKVTISIEESDEQVLSDFSDFMEVVIGIPRGSRQKVFSAELHRLGVANAADLGLDMLCNFGPVIQVKHISFDPDVLEDVIEPLSMDKVIIVCLESHRYNIEAVLAQIGFRDRIQGIITDRDLERWYELALGKYRDKLANLLFRELSSEFRREFPHIERAEEFLRERGYQREALIGMWELPAETSEQMLS